MQTECRISSLLGYYAEVQLILCKDNANRMQNEINVFISLLRCSLSYAKITLISQSDAFYMDYVMISFITIKIGTADFSGRWQEIITS
ncbi:hypothetical protein [Prevotella pectinovora]|uniref:hypothetical protein n=1 Tax=Prevotella pectinovora TaxID=1602169 RepID=UPI002A7F2C02|nr:hypothetical protein [Prevotella pectinovora]